MISGLPPVEGIYFSFVRANGISHRLASTVKDLLQRDGGASKAQAQGYPLVLFLHGFPESWYSWRHQLEFFRDRPYLAIAPDMRGYGSTSQPESVEEYTHPVIARDVVGISEALGYNRFIVVGHDWGSALAWNIALLCPERVIGVCGMSVPYSGTPKAGFLTMLQARHGKCLDKSVPRQERQKATYHYILHHCLPHASEEFDKNTREFLYRIYANRKGCQVDEGTPEHDVNDLMFPLSGDNERDRTRSLDATAAPGGWLRLPRPKTLPEWFNEDDLDYIVAEFQRAKFAGGLRWYQALDLNFYAMKMALIKKDGDYDDKIRSPSLFIVGENDAVVKMYGGKKNILSRFKSSLPNMTRDPIFLQGCGHWIQQESPILVNASLLEFFEGLAKTESGNGLTSRL